MQCFDISVSKDIRFTLRLRIPKWVHGDVRLWINDDKVDITKILKDGFLVIDRTFKDKDSIRLLLPMDVYETALPGDNNTVAFSYGPYALAGLCSEERILYLKGHKAKDILVHENEREWGMWKDSFKTRYQDHGISFVPIKDIGYEKYQVYFSIEE